MVTHFHHGRRIFLAAGSLLLALGLGAIALACPVPVFQYALEHWDGDRYDVIVHHRGQLTDAQRAAVDLLRKAELGDGPVVNMKLAERDYSKMSGDSAVPADLPRLEVRYPAISRRGAFFSSELSLPAVQSLLDSPMRQRIAQRLVERDTAVWVLLESGDRRKDRAAQALLAEELRRLEQTLRVHAPDPDELGADFGQIHTAVKFTMMTLHRDDPAEQAFVHMLLNVEPDLAGFAGEPMVFPIYGRGRIMYALVGRGINRSTLASAGQFLTGPTTGEVKASNPGVDMLLAVDWRDKVIPSTFVGAHGPSGAGSFIDRLQQAEDRLGN
jgi:hypothetical protein